MNSETISWITNVVLAIVLIITALRRRPPLEGQFADQAKNESDHEKLHRRIGDLRDQFSNHFVTRDMFSAAEADRHTDRAEIKEKLDELLQRTAHLVGYGKGAN
jgi:hypothetical protein